MERDDDGNLVPDRKRFPNGMKKLSDYVSIVLKINSWIVTMLSFSCKIHSWTRKLEMLLGASWGHVNPLAPL